MTGDQLTALADYVAETIGNGLFHHAGERGLPQCADWVVRNGRPVLRFADGTEITLTITSTGGLR